MRASPHLNHFTLHNAQLLVVPGHKVIYDSHVFIGAETTMDTLCHRSLCDLIEVQQTLLQKMFATHVTIKPYLLRYTNSYCAGVCGREPRGLLATGCKWYEKQMMSVNEYKHCDSSCRCELYHVGGYWLPAGRN